MSSFDAFLALEKPVNNDQTWGDAMRDNLDAIGYALHGYRVMCVDPHWTTSNLFPGAGSPGVDRRRFNTIQGAIDAAEANAWGGSYLILVMPGVYNENLDIVNGVTIAAAMGGIGGFYPNTVVIQGKDAVADSVITISPADSAFVYVQLIGIGLENTYDTTNATEITEPYLIDAQDQTTYSGTRNKLILKNCQVRMQTWGAGPNVWTYGIKAKGNWHVVVDGCNVTALDNGGGTGQGIVRRLFDIRGNNAQSQTSLLNVKRCDLDNASYDDGTTPILFYMDDRTILTANHCSSPLAIADLWVDGGTGTQIANGVSAGDAFPFLNGWGISGTVVL